MTIPPEISPDGAYWWDGATWQPMPEEEQPDVVVEDQTPGPPPELRRDYILVKIARYFWRPDVSVQKSCEFPPDASEKLRLPQDSTSKHNALR